MNPSYTLFVDVCLTKPIACDNIWMRLVMRIPFVPREGDVIRLTSDIEGVDTLDVTFVNVVYDCESGTFIEQQEDTFMVDAYSEEGVCHEQEAIAKYKAYGFTRLNFPQGVAR